MLGPAGSEPVNKKAGPINLKKPNPNHIFGSSMLLIVTLYFGFQLVGQLQTDQSLQGQRPYLLQLESDIREFQLSQADTVQVLDDARGGIHVLYHLGIKQPTRFIYDYPFFYFEDEQYVKDLRSEFVQDLYENHPKLIVLMKNSSEGTFLLADRAMLFRQFSEFNILLEQKYVLAKDTESYAIFSLIEIVNGEN
jgi:hypothetical protein